MLSLIVYMAAGWRDLCLLLAAVGLNWWVPERFGVSKKTTRIMVIANIAFLAWFKYRVFLGSWFITGNPAALIIPLGISFYIFQLISYQVELGAGQIPERPTFFNFFLYIFFFPHHQAGPIMRPRIFLTCFSGTRTFFTSRLVTGLIIFLWGLFKKVWIADIMAPYVNQQFATFHNSGGRVGNLWLLGATYGVQIYGDFSGYSDMAVGMGRMFGFKFERNFHQPYIAKNAREFWNRWHITLSHWLRDMIYIPLGGGRASKSRIALNLFLVMLIGGLWHGAGWNFVLWGALHGLLLISARFLPKNRMLQAPGFLVFQLFVLLTWVPFREPNIGCILHAMTRPSAWLGSASIQAMVWFAAILMFSWMEDFLEHQFVGIIRRLLAIPLPAFAMSYGTAMFLLLTYAGQTTAFIYQRF